MTQSPYTCLWFDGNAKEAATFYCSVFPNSQIISDNGMTIGFELNGTKMMGLNGGPQFTFNEAISFVISCESQEEIDYYWEKLTNEGEESMCGWLKDKYGVSWQVVPTQLGSLMSDPEKRPRVIEAFLKMKKFDLNALLAL
jgi:predicted 3-demethylubiquinone-9 3-methyltransferase (glyoxalase superfamily)